MPEIRPFRAWRYSAAKVKDLARVVAPPYDVISKQEQARLYEASPYNVIRMELGREQAGDTPVSNRYTRAKDFLDGLKSRGVLSQETDPSFYVYVQDYVEEGKKKTRTGFFAAMRLDEKAVLKHENTLSGPKEDRLHLLKAVRTNLSPIFGLFEDASGSVQSLLKRAAKSKPVLDVKVAGVRHRLYLEERAGLLRSIASKMKAKPMFIADGHHRFEVACQFKKWMAEQAGSPGEAEYVLTYFSDVRHNPFKIFPTHRLLKVTGSKPVEERLRTVGTVRKVSERACLYPTKPYQFGVFSKKTGFLSVQLSPKNVSRIDKKNPVDRLDVAVLHKQIVGPLFGIHAIEKSASIDFTRDPKEAVEKVKKGEWDLALFLRPTSLDDMLQASKKGLKMPQKSTYFYPKLLTGLVFYGFDGGLS